MHKWSWIGGGGGGTYSLSIRVRDIKISPPPLRARSGRLDDVLFVRQRFTRRRKKMGKERKEREIWAPDVLVIEADPKHRPPIPRRSFRNHITHSCHGDYQRKKPQRLQVIWNYLWNQHGRTRGKSQNEEEERGRDAAACGTWKYMWMWALAFASVQNPPQFCYCVTIGETCKCIFVILILNIPASTTCNQSLKQNKNSKCWDW